VIAFRKRERIAGAAPAAAARLPGRADALAQEIAALDLAHSSRAGERGVGDEEYKARRALLKKKLAALLARGES
jgi:hypothetical protein